MTDPEPARWGCTVCSYCYDAVRGDPENGVPAATPFSKVPEDWVCPWCGADKDMFEPDEDL